MSFFKSALSRVVHKLTPVVAINMSVDDWCDQSLTQPTQFVKRVEICAALGAGQHAFSIPIGKSHYHTLLRVFVVSTRDGPCLSQDTLLIERVHSVRGVCHSVTPIEETLSTGSHPFSPHLHDRVCAISDGPSTALAHHLKVERTLEFGDGLSQPHLTLAQFAQIVDYVRRTMVFIYSGDCQFQSRLFAFTCLGALGPTLPPSIGKGLGMNVELDGEVVGDSLFESGARDFLNQPSWLVNDPASVQPLGLIRGLKGEPRKRVEAD